jgi:hypothetical protein
MDIFNILNESLNNNRLNKNDEPNNTIQTKYAYYYSFKGLLEELRKTFITEKDKLLKEYDIYQLIIIYFKLKILNLKIIHKSKTLTSNTASMTLTANTASQPTPIPVSNPLPVIEEQNEESPSALSDTNVPTTVSESSTSSIQPPPLPKPTYKASLLNTYKKAVNRDMQSRNHYLKKKEEEWVTLPKYYTNSNTPIQDVKTYLNTYYTILTEKEIDYLHRLIRRLKKDKTYRNTYYTE